MTLSQPGVVRGRVVTPEAVVEDGVVVHDGDAIRWVGAVGEAPAELAEVAARAVPHEGFVLPGLVDLH
ncbi:MAG TPA: N-acetylglucosamine-6-phosphate deacetylase, partial [Actinomycetaceae bacterium]|nr:N-acetylglucosamine-6-phosphate deacetylase [Actinomycetaceae bacterium]